MKKILGVCGIALIVGSSYSMEFLSHEGQEALRRLKHAEFVMTPHGKIAEIKLKKTQETSQYCEEVKTTIKQRLGEFFRAKFPGFDCSVYIDKFSQIFDEYHSGPLHSYFGSHVSSAYCVSIQHLLSIEELVTEIR
jgi:hypothetical protein